MTNTDNVRYKTDGKNPNTEDKMIILIAIHVILLKIIIRMIMIIKF